MKRVLVALVLVAVLAGGVLAVEFGMPENVSVESFEAGVTVSDGPRIPEAAEDSGVATCTAVGPAPGELSVRVEARLRTAGERVDLDDRFRVRVAVSGVNGTATDTVTVDATERVTLLRTLPEDGGIEPGAEVTVELTVLDGPVTVARETTEVVADGGGRTDCE